MYDSDRDHRNSRDYYPEDRDDLLDADRPNLVPRHRCSDCGGSGYIEYCSSPIATSPSQRPCGSRDPDIEGPWDEPDDLDDAPDDFEE